jgi:hypothetical protein
VIGSIQCRPDLSAPTAATDWRIIVVDDFATVSETAQAPALWRPSGNR